MEFLNSEAFILILIPSLVFSYFIFGLSKGSGLGDIFDKNILNKIKFDNNSLGLMGRNLFLFLALFFMIVAFARPVMDKQEITVNKSSYDLVVGIDVSKSMKASDIYPDRFSFAKEKFNRFVEFFEDASIGVVAFSNSAFLLSPITEDSTTLKYLVGNLDMSYVSTKGTDILSPIEITEQFLKNSSQKILILFTDGGDNKSFEEEIKRANEYGINVYIFAIGTKKGTTISDNGDIIKDSNGKIVITSLNENIKELALGTNGAYIKATNSNEALKLLIDDIKAKFKKSKKEATTIVQYRELFYYPLGFALLFLLIAFSSLPIKRGSMVFVLVLASVFTPRAEALFLDFIDIKEAKKSYENKNYGSATESYTKIVEDKKSNSSYYNLANSYYKDKKYKEAIDTYNEVDNKNSDMEFKKHYNSGNSYAKLKKLKEALKSYEKALKIKDDKDAKYNRDLVKKILEKQNKKDKKNKDKKDDKKKKNNKKDDKKKKNSDKNNKNSNKKKENQNKQNQKDKKKSSEKNKQKKDESFMSDLEEKKWDKHLKKNRPKIVPMEIKSKKAGKNETYW